MATEKKPRGRKPKPEAFDNSLLDALQFIAAAQRSQGTPQQTHCILREGWAVASDSVLTIGHRITDDLLACPQTQRLIDALQRCKTAFSVTQLDADRLSVKAGGFRVSVPCLPLDSIGVVWADPQIVPLDSSFLDACRVVAGLATEGAQRVALAAVLMAGPTVIATNGIVAMEAWHGQNLPPFMLLPKTAVAALLKITKKLIGFGCSATSVTFHYEDGSWFKTQCYDDKYPDTNRVMNRPNAGPMLDVPEGLFDAVRQIAPFANTEQVRFETDRVSAVTIDRDAAEHDVPGLIGGSMFGVKHLLLIADHVKQLDTTTSDSVAYFLGDKLRGVIAKVVEKK